MGAEESVKGRDYQFERKKYDELTTAQVKRYITEMSRLEKEEGFIREDSFHDVKAPHHIMYKVETENQRKTSLISKDGNRAYEFLIEFDTMDPSYGIYYGCKGLVLNGDQDEQNSIFTKEWEMIKGEVTNVLNNTFADIDFSCRYLPTNNVDNKTYWPFWIALYDNEDIIAVAARAIKLIKNLYAKMLSGELRPKKKMHSTSQKKTAIKTYYTQEAYDSLIKDLGDQTRIQKFEKFLNCAVQEGILEIDPRYEKCWKVKNMKNVDFSYLLVELCKYMDLPGGSNVWSCLTRVFLSRTDGRFDQIRKSFNYSKRHTDETDSKGEKRTNFPEDFCRRILK